MLMFFIHQISYRCWPWKLQWLRSWWSSHDESRATLPASHRTTSVRLESYRTFSSAGFFLIVPAVNSLSFFPCVVGTKSAVDLLHWCSTSISACRPGQQTVLHGWERRDGGSGGLKGSVGGRGEGKEEGHGWFLSMLDPADRLDLRGLSMATILPVVPVLASVAVTLHNVLVTTVTRILVAYKAREIGTQRQHVTMEASNIDECSDASPNWSTLTPLSDKDQKQHKNRKPEC